MTSSQPVHQVAVSKNSPAPFTQSPPATAAYAPAVPNFDLDDDDEMTRISQVRRFLAPTATLRVTDGQEFTVTGTALLGRKPQMPNAVKADQLLKVEDIGRSLSKAHLLFGVDDDGVWIVDQNSTNGTVVTLPDGAQIICAGGQKVRIPSGATVTAGDVGIDVTFLGRGE